MCFEWKFYGCSKWLRGWQSNKSDFAHTLCSAANVFYGNVRKAPAWGGSYKAYRSWIQSTTNLQHFEYSIDFPTRNHPYNFFIPFSILDRIMSAKPSPMCSESIESRFISCPIWEHFMQNKLLAFTVPVDVIEHRPTDVCQCLTLKYKFEIDAEMCFTLSPISICHCRR